MPMSAMRKNNSFDFGDISSSGGDRKSSKRSSIRRTKSDDDDDSVWDAQEQDDFSVSVYKEEADFCQPKSTKSIPAAINVSGGGGGGGGGLPPIDPKKSSSTSGRKVKSKASKQKQRESFTEGMLGAIDEINDIAVLDATGFPVLPSQRKQATKSNNNNADLGFRSMHTPKNPVMDFPDFPRDLFKANSEHFSTTAKSSDSKNGYSSSPSSNFKSLSAHLEEGRAHKKPSKISDKSVYSEGMKSTYSESKRRRGRSSDRPPRSRSKSVDRSIKNFEEATKVRKGKKEDFTGDASASAAAPPVDEPKSPKRSNSKDPEKVREAGSDSKNRRGKSRERGRDTGMDSSSHRRRLRRHSGDPSDLSDAKKELLEMLAADELNTSRRGRARSTDTPSVAKEKDNEESKSKGVISLDEYTEKVNQTRRRRKHSSDDRSLVSDGGSSRRKDDKRKSKDKSRSRTTKDKVKEEEERLETLRHEADLLEQKRLAEEARLKKLREEARILELRREEEEIRQRMEAALKNS